MLRIEKIACLIVCLTIIMPIQSWAVEVGDPLPDFAVQTFDGNTSSRATMQGKPLLLIFWNTWCPNCMRELPEINRLAGKFHSRDLRVLAINTAMNDSERKARAYWEKSGYMFKSGFDHDFQLGQIFGVRGVPTIFLVDSKGFVRYKQAELPANMEEQFARLTGGK